MVKVCGTMKNPSKIDFKTSKLTLRNREKKLTKFFNDLRSLNNKGCRNQFKGPLYLCPYTRSKITAISVPVYSKETSSRCKKTKLNYPCAVVIEKHLSDRNREYENLMFSTLFLEKSCSIRLRMVQ